MKATLEELKGIMDGIIGSFVIDENGEVAALELSEPLAEKAKKLSKLIHYVTTVMRSTRPFERIIIDSESLKLLTMSANEKMLVVIADKDIHLPLLKLVSMVAVKRLKEEKRHARDKKRITSSDINSICNFYEVLFTAVAKRLIDIFGGEAAQMFDKKLEEIKEDHPRLLADVSFDPNSTLKMSRVKMNAAELSRDELKAGLEDVLVSMLETLKFTAGANVADKAIDDIIRIKEEQEGF